MTENHNKPFRIAAVSLSANGIGYAIMEGNALVEYRNKVFLANKNANSLTNIDKLILRYQADILVLHDVNAKGTYRAPRIKELNRKVVALAKKRRLTVVKISNTELRTLLLDDPKGTKHDMALRIAKQFPDELASRVPPKRKAWTSELNRMDIFDAVGLAVGFRAFQRAGFVPAPSASQSFGDGVSLKTAGTLLKKSWQELQKNLVRISKNNQKSLPKMRQAKSTNSVRRKACRLELV